MENVMMMVIVFASNTMLDQLATSVLMAGLAGQNVLALVPLANPASSTLSQGTSSSHQ